jgi:hypothetical protein
MLPDASTARPCGSFNPEATVLTFRLGTHCRQARGQEPLGADELLHPASSSTAVQTTNAERTEFEMCTGSEPYSPRGAVRRAKIISRSREYCAPPRRVRLFASFVNRCKALGFPCMRELPGAKYRQRDSPCNDGGVSARSGFKRDAGRARLNDVKPDVQATCFQAMPRR